MNREQLRAHLLRNIDSSIRNGDEYVRKVRKEQEEAVADTQEVQTPSISLTSGATEQPSTDAKLAQLLLKVVRDNGKVEQIIADPKLTIEYKKSLIYNWNSVLERLKNVKNTSMSIDEFQSFLVAIAKANLASEHVFNTVSNKNEDQPPTEQPKGKDKDKLETEPVDKKQEKYNSMLTYILNDNRLQMESSSEPLHPEASQYLNIDAVKRAVRMLAKIDKCPFNIAYAKTGVADATISKELNEENWKRMTGLSMTRRNLINDVYNRYIKQVTSYKQIMKLPFKSAYEIVKAVYRDRKRSAPSQSTSTASAAATAAASVDDEATFAPTVQGSGLTGAMNRLTFGRFYVPRDRLNMNVIEVRYTKSRHLANMKPCLVSARFRELVEDVAKGTFDRADIAKLSQKENALFRHIMPMLGLEIHHDDNDVYMQRFKIIQGEIQAGNRNRDVLKEANDYLLHFLHTNQITRHTFNTIRNQLDL